MTPSESIAADGDSDDRDQTSYDAPSSSDPAAWLRQAARHSPQRAFIETSEGRVFTYSELAELSARLVAVLISHSVAPGDRVVVQAEKSIESIALYVACLRMGAVIVPLNTAYTVHEFGYFIRDSEPKLIVIRPEDLSTIGRSMPERDRSRIQTLGTATDGTLLGTVHRSAGTLTLESKFEPSSLAALLYTSGTTGKPKAAMLTRGNLASNAATLTKLWRFAKSDVLLHVLPIFHAHGLFVAINTVLASAASMVLVSKFEAERAVQLLQKATVMMGVPTYYKRLLECAGLSRSTTQSMRLFISGSAPLAADDHKEFEKRTGHRILERYGMTETLMNTSNPYDGERVPGSVGVPLTGVEVRITDPQDGGVLPDSGAIGMIEVRGPNVFSGYWRNPEKTAADFRADGFFVTGDIGQIDAQGYVRIIARAKDLIISGGYNVYPMEVEQELNAIFGVFESAVFAVPHPDFGEGVTAVIVRSPHGVGLDESAVLRKLKDRLAGYKRPKRVLFTSELPRNAMGKVQKQVLRDVYAALYLTS